MRLNAKVIFAGLLISIFFIFGKTFGLTNDEDSYKVKIYSIKFERASKYNSSLPDMTLSDHKITYMFDGDEKTAFCIRNPAVGGYVLYVTLQDFIKVDEIRIFNGYGKNKDLYFSNMRFNYMKIGINRIEKNRKTLRYTPVSSGYNFDDKYEYVSFNIDYLTYTNWNGFLFLLDYSYDGNPNRKSNDAFISEIQFWYKGKRYEIENLNNLEEKIVYGEDWIKNDIIDGEVSSTLPEKIEMKVSFEQWAHYLIYGGAPRKIISDLSKEWLPHRLIGKIIFDFVEDHGVSGFLFWGLVSIFITIITWGEGPSKKIKKAKGGLKFREIVMWYLGFPAVIILFIAGIVMQIRFFINGYFG